MGEFFRAHYRVCCAAAEIEARAQALALEQSVELPLAGVRDPVIRESIVGRVEAIVPESQGCYRVALGLALATTGDEPGQLLNMLFGNCSLQPDVSLIDIDVPAALARAFAGPRFGIAGIRRAVQASGRAITCCALKPQGLAPDALARLAGVLACAGIDVIKDDHGIADQAYAPFAERVPAVQRAIDQANRVSGRRAVYAPTLSGSPRRLAEQLRILAGEGVGMALACPALIGYPVFTEVLAGSLGVPVLAHPAFAGGRIAPALLFGTLFRLLGADAVIYPNHGGRFAYSPDECRAIADAARRPLHDLAPAMPVPAGGMRIERVEEMLGFYGTDTMLLIGGDVLSADDVEARARAFVEAVERCTLGRHRTAIPEPSEGVQTG